MTDTTQTAPAGRITAAQRSEAREIDETLRRLEMALYSHNRNWLHAARYAYTLLSRIKQGAQNPLRAPLQVPALAPERIKTFLAELNALPRPCAWRDAETGEELSEIDMRRLVQEALSRGESVEHDLITEDNWGRKARVAMTIHPDPKGGR